MITWNTYLPDILRNISCRSFRIPGKISIGTDAYIVPSPDRQDLQFAYPIEIFSDILSNYNLPVSSSAGAVHAIIEYSKKESIKRSETGTLWGFKTSNPARYSANIEPCTVAFSETSISSALWRPDYQNRMTNDGIRMVIRGAFPYIPPDKGNLSEVESLIGGFTESMVNTAVSTPGGIIKREWAAVYDQQDIRKNLDRQGLFCIIGDGAKPARSFTRHRSWYRVAGPKCGVNIPFYCPKELDPIEIHLTGSNQTITALGIKKAEIFAITGSNAEGKSTLLQAIHAGEDDHAPGDGRELIVTKTGGALLDATNIELRGADLTPFFNEIPPGITGDAKAASGNGSGSASMAFRFNQALRRSVPYIIIDEDRSAINLLIPCYMTSANVKPLASLLKDRRWLSETSLVIAGSGVELVIAQSDRILKLSDHKAVAVSVKEYCDGLKKHYSELKDLLDNIAYGI